MNSKLAQEIEKLLPNSQSKETISFFRQKLDEGNFTRHEDPQNHFCAYFAACDFKNKQLFIGHHKKANLWLFNGGHIDQGENLRETVAREIMEEWGLDINELEVGEPSLITTAEINNPDKQTCRLHLDIWHFVNVNKSEFNPDPLKLAEEFHSVEWVSMDRAREMMVDKGTLEALDYIEANYFNL
jgi:8-oxo-dGTP pyrophosphatase MutT (NUDIX family)